MKDITGQRFGRLVALEFRYYDGRHQDCWLFQCDCGKEKIMPAASVKWGRVRSCGCLAKEHMAGLNKKEIAGQRFDRLVAVCPTKKRDAAGSILWECQCDCGNLAYYSVNALLRHRVHSCGCLYQESRKECASHRKDFIENTSLSSIIVSKKLRANNSSGCTGVSFNQRKNCWQAYINFQKKRYFLGSFPEKEQAIKARKLAEQKLHDPVVIENWGQITEASRAFFSAYIEGQ